MKTMKKPMKLIAILLLLAMTLSITGTATASGPQALLTGDVNGDGKVDIMDALEILKHLAGIASVVDDDPLIKCPFCNNSGGPLVSNCELCTLWLGHECVPATVPDADTFYLGQSYPVSLIPAHSPRYMQMPNPITQRVLHVFLDGDEAYISRTDTNLTGPGGEDNRLKGGTENGLPVPNPHPAWEFIRQRVEGGVGSGDASTGASNVSEVDRTLTMRRLTIRRGGTYVLQGNYNGQIYVNARGENQEPVILILNGVTINNVPVGPSGPDGPASGPAIHVNRSSNFVIRLVNGTVNTLTDSERYHDLYCNLTHVVGQACANIDCAEDDGSGATTEPRATIYSRYDITISGRGTLNINARHRDAVHSRDSVFINGGKYNIDTKNIGTASPFHPSKVPTIAEPNLGGGGTAIHGRDGILINNGDFNIAASNHGLRANNPNDPSDPEQAFSGYITITNGRFDMAVLGRGLHASSVLKIDSRSISSNSGPIPSVDIKVTIPYVEEED